MKSRLSQVTSAEPHRWILGLVKFKLFFNDLNDGIYCALDKWLIDWMVAAIQSDIYKTEKWANRSLVNFNKASTKACTWRQNNPMYQLYAGYHPAGKQPFRKGPRVHSGQADRKAAIQPFCKKLSILPYTASANELSKTLLEPLLQYINI